MRTNASQRASSTTVTSITPLCCIVLLLVTSLHSTYVVADTCIATATSDIVPINPGFTIPAAAVWSASNQSAAVSDAASRAIKGGFVRVGCSEKVRESTTKHG